VGTKAAITLELRPPRQKSLNATVSVIASEYKISENSSTGGEKNAPNIQIHALNETDQYYIDNEWTTSSVADVDIETDAVHIFINDSNKHLTKLITKAQQYNTQAVESIKNRYREHIAFCAFMMDQNKVRERLIKEDTKDSISESQLEMIKKADLENACETIVDLLNDFFQVIITESKEE